ncbi:hypothetical protein [Plantactinospora soyae]|uniref:Uncharacterized protein n=1 Tax=Plantactinospora soyae TaxID=1544732 RepID=A0A927R1L4_9ACTN|nr:hypothetical protein [Plantactinospora soyae]MBE1491522.1 hypothetical protein [Plantactinospora soyae]
MAGPIAFPITACRRTDVTTPVDPGRHPRDEPEGDIILMHIDKGEILASLRSRGLHARADWVDRELPTMVDTHKHSSLLQMLGVDPTARAPDKVGSAQR